MPRQLFGTDGIRGVAGESPLDSRTVYAFGIALGEWAARTALAHGVAEATVALGMDTRESGPWLSETVAAGVRRGGARIRSAGVTTTPGVAYLTKVEDFLAGVMISASHNPYQDNGLKVFDHSGFKLPDTEEHRLEQRIFEVLAEGAAPERLPLSEDPELDRHYVDFLASTFHGSLQGLRIVLDCANGAAYQIAPGLFQRLGATVILMGAEPSGRNINLNCGALHTDHLRKRVLEEDADVGAAFDGDADRCMMVSRLGRHIDGDHMLLVAGRDLHAAGKLGGDGSAAVVATVMSNLGLERALQKSGIALKRTSVGDKYVLEEMVRCGLPLGGEQSGHVIFRQFATTGDGLLTALRVLEIAQRSGQTLDDLVADLQVYPQKLVNIRFREKRPLEELADVQAEIRATEAEFGPAGRVLVRFSGTEPLARVMVEGPTEERVAARAGAIADAIARALA